MRRGTGATPRRCHSRPPRLYGLTILLLTSAIPRPVAAAGTWSWWGMAPSSIRDKLTSSGVASAHQEGQAQGLAPQAPTELAGEPRYTVRADLSEHEDTTDWLPSKWVMTEWPATSGYAPARSQYSIRIGGAIVPVHLLFLPQSAGLNTALTCFLRSSRAWPAPIRANGRETRRALARA
jgi:hypothetical protein